MVIKLNIIGNFFGSDGYSSHTRQLANALNDLDEVEVTMTTNIPQGWETVVSDKEMEMLKRDREKCDTILCIATPPSWKYYMCEGKKFIGFCINEGDVINSSWLEIMADDRVNTIFVASEHSKAGILNTEIGIKKYNNFTGWTEDEKGMNREKIKEKIKNKIHIIPHGVNIDIFKPQPIDHKEFTFVANKGFRNLEDRGGLQYLLKAYLEEFTSKDNVNLLMKLNPAYGIPNIHQFIKELKIENKDLPKLNLMVENLRYEELQKIYNMGDVFVSPTRSEAFNLGCIEAMACGLPVITTDFGGQTDFVEDLENGWLISGELKLVEHEIEYEGIQWLTPDISFLRNILRKVYESASFISYKENALKTAKEYTWQHSADKALNALKTL